MKIPLVNLSRQHEDIAKELQLAFGRVLKKHCYIQGEEVEAFENAWAEYTGIAHVIGCANGTDAIELILTALGVGPGDEVITVSLTFFATVEAIVALGATPILVDIKAEDGLIDPSRVEQAITKQTKAIIGVHLYGQPVDVDALLRICAAHDLFFIEDAAQAHGALYKGKHTGNFGIAAAFSFYPGKNLGALGDAGAVVTSNTEPAVSMRLMRDHGRRPRDKYLHHEFGRNMRMDGLQAAFLSAKLQALDKWLADRRKVAMSYQQELSRVDDLRLMSVAPEVEHAYHLFVVNHAERDNLIKLLAERGVQAGIHYPLGCHQQPAWERHFDRVSLPNTELLSSSCCSLPIFGGMTENEAGFVIEAVKEALRTL